MNICICSFPWAGQCESCIDETAKRGVSLAASTIKDDGDE